MVSFHEEQRNFLEAYGVDHDERFVWDWSKVVGRPFRAHTLKRIGPRNPGRWPIVVNLSV